MIPRYSRKQMTDIWEEQNRFEIWVKIEIAALEAMEQINICLLYTSPSPRD